jgi:sulfur relay (sulfurtransferase) complex TusBCD TusD component (DsrE family)
MKALIIINDARGLKEMKFIDGAELSSMKELTQLVMESDRVITF